MKRNLFLILCLTLVLGLFSATSLYASYVEIGTGTGTNYYVPCNGLYDYSWSRTIYLQTEIGSAIDITEISYNVSNIPTSYQMLDQSIYMKLTDDAVFATSDYVDTTGYTLVFSGNITWDGSGWQTITLDTPFIYDGTSNLEIYYINNDGDWTTGYPNFYFTAQTDRAVYKYADTTFPTTAGTLGNYAANIRLHYMQEGAPGTPTNPTPENNAVSVAPDTGISWTNGADTDDVQVLFDTVNPPVNEVYNDVAITSLTNVEIGGPLEANTTYYWQVIASNATEYTSSGPVWNFTTELEEGYQIGFDTINNTTTGYPAPYGNFYYGARHQMIIPVAELNAAGMVAPGNINSLGFDVAGDQGTQLENFTIKIRTTNVTSLTEFIVDDLNTVWGPAPYADIAGWNVHDFTTPFFWDGASNLLVETSFHNTSYTSNAIFNQSATTGYTSTIVYRADSGYNYDTPTVNVSSEQRPNIFIIYDLLEPDFDNDMAGLSVSGPDVVNLGTEYTYTVSVINVGVNTQSVFDVEMLIDGTTVATVAYAGDPLETYDTAQVELNWTPAAEGNVAVAGKVVLAGDENLANDETDPLSVSVVGLPVSGTFEINGNGTGDFLTFAEAIDYIALAGIDGPVVFNVAPGIYEEQVEVVEVMGASEVNTITFNGLDTRQDAIITYVPTESGARHIIRSDGAKHFRFNNLSIVVGEGATYGWPVHLLSNSQDIEITNCRLITDDVATSSSFCGLVISGSTTSPTTGATNVSDILIENNTITGGYYGIITRGSSSTATIQNLQVLNNEVIDSYYYGLYIYYTTEPILKYNTINIRQVHTYGYGAYLYYTYGPFEFS